MFDNHFQLNPDLVTSVGVVSGEKIPVITDRNPHLEVKTLDLWSIEHLILQNLENIGKH